MKRKRNYTRKKEFIDEPKSYPIELLNKCFSFIPFSRRSQFFKVSKAANQACFLDFHSNHISVEEYLTYICSTAYNVPISNIRIQQIFMEGNLEEVKILSRYNRFRILSDYVEYAAKGGHYHVVKYVIDKIPLTKVNWKNSILYAIRNSHNDIFDFLNQKGLLNNWSNDQLFCHRIVTAVLESENLYVLSSDVIQIAKVKLLNTCFSNCCSIEMIRAVIDMGTSIERHHMSLCLDSVEDYSRKTEIIKFLINNYRFLFEDLRGVVGTAIIFACKNGGLELIKFFVEKGYSLDFSSENDSPLSAAISSENFELLCFMFRNCNLSQSAIEAKMETAIKDGNRRLVRFFMEEGVKISTRLAEEIKVLTKRK